MIKETTNFQTDEILYKKFLLEDSKESFNELIIKHRKALTSFIKYYIKDNDIAEDIAQDSFLYIIINRKDYDFKYSFRTYLYTIAKSRTLNYLKKEKKKIYLDDIDLENMVSDISVEDEAVNNYDKEEIRNAIKQLKREYQIIIALYYFQGFKYKEISEIMNISMSKTKMSINRAKKDMKKLLKEGERNDRSRIC